MNLVVVLEQRFNRCNDGSICTSGTFTYEFWTRYLAVFDRVTVVARVAAFAETPSGCKEVEGPGVSVHAIPYYQGPLELLRTLPQLRAAMRSAKVDGSAVILRVPGMVSGLFHRFAMASTHPFAVEIVGDPWDVFAPGAVQHPLRPFLRRTGARRLRHLCQQAIGVAYVSLWELPERYPPAPDAFVTSYSSIELEPSHFVAMPRVYDVGVKRSLRLVLVGSLEQPYKGADVLIDAMNEVLLQVPNASLTIVGDGKYRRSLEQRVASHGLAHCVEFVGRVPAGEAVRQKLDEADVFVLPSRTEGLPRAMIEAMARGLPCIGTHVGGIPELLDEDALVPVNDTNSLSRKLMEIAQNPDRMTGMAKRNWEKAMYYRSDMLNQRRQEFYQYVRYETERAARSIVK